MIGTHGRDRAGRRGRRPRSGRFSLERLEDRVLLYSTTGDLWSHPARITYSIVPDGTSIGGVRSNLQATLNARFSTSAWMLQLTKAAAAWEKVANVNLVQVPDSGAAIGVWGYQQGDPRFGDIRIGGFVEPSNQLAFAFLPPAANGGSDAGDIFFNTAQPWQVNGSGAYNFMTVALHEFGHALGMDHSRFGPAAMYSTYVGAKSALTTDDVAGIQSIYGNRRLDAFAASGQNNVPTRASNITPWIDSRAQVSLPSLDLVPPQGFASGDPHWFKVTVPWNTSGTMVVRMQSTNLSLLSPSLAVYNANATRLLGQQSSQAYGDTVSVAIGGVAPGQTYEIRTDGANNGDSGYGSYALQLNFSNRAQPPVPPPYTVVSPAPDRGGGARSDSSGAGLLPAGQYIQIGSLSGFVDELMVGPAASSTGHARRPEGGAHPAIRPRPDAPADGAIAAGASRPASSSSAASSGRHPVAALMSSFDRAIETWRL